MTTPELHAAIENLGTALEALDSGARLELATETLTAGGVRSTAPAEARAFWRAIHAATSGATPERLDRIVSTLEVGGPALRQSLVIIARRAQTGDPRRGPLWAALCTLADAVVA